MNLVVFGLAISSSWGNGHATVWRGLLRALIRRGHAVAFFERDVPYYAAHRDLEELPDGELVLYRDWPDVLPRARRRVREADVAMVTSYCPDGLAATELVLASSVPCKAFYDLDTPVTLERLETGQPVSYVGPRGLGDFDLVLSYTGGAALRELSARLGARRVAPLYGSVDPTVHRRVPPEAPYLADLSYLGTFAEDRQSKLERLLIEPARRRPERRFVVGGPLYPRKQSWAPNISFVHHVPPRLHPAFYSSARLALNVTRGAMAAMGYCPSARLFEAAACNVPVVSDEWEGLDQFFQPGSEILTAQSTQDILDTLQMPDGQLVEIALRARERVLDEHTAERRAREFERLIQDSPPSADQASLASHSDQSDGRSRSAARQFGGLAR